MGADLPYYLAMWLVALGVIILCGGGITYGYVSEGKWGQRRGQEAQSRAQKAGGVLADRATSGGEAEQDREPDRLAA